MKITMVSQLSGKIRTREVPVTPEKYFAWVTSNVHIQVYFPELSANDREFMLTGITPEEWDEVFQNEEI